MALRLLRTRLLLGIGLAICHSCLLTDRRAPAQRARSDPRCSRYRTTDAPYRGRCRRPQARRRSSDGAWHWPDARQQVRASATCVAIYAISRLLMNCLAASRPPLKPKLTAPRSRSAGTSARARNTRHREDRGSAQSAQRGARRGTRPWPDRSCSAGACAHAGSPDRDSAGRRFGGSGWSRGRA